MQDISNCACAVHVCAAGDAWGVPSACLGGAWHGMAQNGHSV